MTHHGSGRTQPSQSPVVGAFAQPWEQEVFFLTDVQAQLCDEFGDQFLTAGLTGPGAVQVGGEFAELLVPCSMCRGSFHVPSTIRPPERTWSIP